MQKSLPQPPDRARPFFSAALLLSAVSFLISCGFSVYTAVSSKSPAVLIFIAIAFFGIILPALAGLRMPFWTGVFFLIIGGFISYISAEGQIYWTLAVSVPVLIAGICYLISFALQKK